MGNKYFIFFLFLLAIVNLLTLDNYHNWGDDFSLYLHESKAIISNDLVNLVRVNSEMMAQKKMGANLYPIGYPLILTPFIYFKSSLLAIKILNVLFLSGSILLIRAISQHYIANSVSNVISLLFGASSFIFFSTNEILSDIPAFFFALVVLLLILKWRYKTNLTFRTYILYFFFALITLITRTAYLTFIIGIVCVFLLDHLVSRSRNWKNCLTEITLAALPALTVLALNKVLIISDGSNESKELNSIILNPSLLFSVIQKNIIYYFELFSLGLINSKLLILLLLVPVYFIEKQSFQRVSLQELSTSTFRLNRYLFLCIIFLFTLSIFLCWPSKQGYRFILLNMGILFILISSLLKMTSLWINRGFAILYLYLFIWVPIYSRLESNYTTDKSISLQRIVKKGEPGTKDFNAMIAYIKRSLPKGAIIYFAKPRALHYFAERKSYFLNTPKQLKSGDWVLLWNNEGYVSLKSACGNNLHLSSTSGSLKLYQLL